MSPAATMTADESRRSVLDVAGELFYDRGIGGVVMSDIRDSSGVSMRRLYAMYPSKGELVAAWLADRHFTWMAWFTISVDRFVAAGTDPVLAVFDALAEWVMSPDYRGCAFINSLAETHEIDVTHRRIIARHKRELLDHLARLAARDHRRKGLRAVHLAQLRAPVRTFPEALQRHGHFRNRSGRCGQLYGHLGVHLKSGVLVLHR